MREYFPIRAQRVDDLGNGNYFYLQPNDILYFILSTRPARCRVYSDFANRLHPPWTQGRPTRARVEVRTTRETLVTDFCSMPDLLREIPDLLDSDPHPEFFRIAENVIVNKNKVYETRLAARLVCVRVRPPGRPTDVEAEWIQGSDRLFMRFHSWWQRRRRRSRGPNRSNLTA